MNGHQLERAIAVNPCIQQFFRGVFARDTLPNIVERYPAVYVVNTDYSYRSGQHWVSIVLRDPSYGIFFDSFGRTPERWRKEFKDFIDKHVKRYDYFNVQIQSIDSSYCGLFVLAFLYAVMCMFLTIEQFKTVFQKNVMENDAIVYSFLHGYLNLL